MGISGKAPSFHSGRPLVSLNILAILLLQQTCVSSQQQSSCSPSSCGKISNISHPFRLKHDPQHCGDLKYELACENNITIISLFSGKYHVQAINYNNFTIRLVDPGIQEAGGGCSSVPRYFLYHSNFSKVSSRSYDATQERLFSSPMFQHIIYLNCSNPVRDDPQYVDTAPCVNWNNSKGHIYAIAGDLAAGSFKDGCGVKLLGSISRDWDWGLVGQVSKSISYADIHRALAFGFEVSWLRRACQDLTEDPSELIDCYFNETSEEVQFKYHFQRCTILGAPIIDICGLWPQLRLLAQQYRGGIFEGLDKVTRLHRMFSWGRSEYDDYLGRNTYDFYLGGIVTGQYIIPYIISRLLFGIIFLAVVYIYKWRRRHLSRYDNIELFLQGYNLMPIRYSYQEIKQMTKGFKEKLGEGGFGSVYKGKLRSGPCVAIKMLGKSKASGQDFINEVATIGRIHHMNVVRLIGFCVEGSKRVLVYEYMPNGSLDKYIFSKEAKCLLSYEKIYEISLGVARGMAYLHQGCDMRILHFDIKPHNILLDENFVPKVSDFGLAKLHPVDDSIVTLSVARGTIGYMAPELFYKNIGGVSYKADIYSFGMLLMEMANKRRNVNPHAENSSQIFFPTWIYDQFSKENDIELEDLTENEKMLSKKMIIVALWCIQLKPQDRPSMNKAVEMLEGEVESLVMPPKPLLYPREMPMEDQRVSSGQSLLFNSNSINSTSSIS